jgi:hypothetical protein
MAQPKPLKADRPSYDRSDLRDSDRDGLSDEFETRVLGTQPNRKDTDGDGLSDLEERAYGTNPTKWSSDGDGLSDKQEYAKGTNPWLSDSDEDGFHDHLDRRPISRLDDADNNRRDDYWDRLGVESKKDNDGDSLTNTDERWLRTDGDKKDSDGDKVDDRDEVHLRTNPRDPTHTPISSADDTNLSPDSSIGDDLAAIYIEQPAVDAFLDPTPRFDDTVSGHAFDFSAAVEPAADTYDIDAAGCSGEVGEL